MSRWFRHFAGLCRDEKLVRAALKAKQPVERVVWVYAAILESAAEENDEGRYEIDHAEMAYFIRCGEDEIAAIVNALCDLGRIDETHVSKWSERQFVDNAADRARKWREKQKDLKTDKTECDANVRERSDDVHRTQNERPYTDTDTETNTKLITAPRVAKRAKQRSSISENQQPDEKDREHAKLSGLSDLDFRTEWGKFRDYHRSRGSLMADWNAAWRTWIANRSLYGARTAPTKQVAAIGVAPSDKQALASPGKRYAISDSDEWAIAADRYFAETGKYPPRDSAGGWWFPERYFTSSQTVAA